jgi:L-lactate dehydrogenase complex protein LldG
VSTSRDEILHRVRAAPPAALSAPVPRTYRRRGERSTQEQVTVFAERARDYGAEVHHSADVRTTTAEVCLARGADRLGIPPGLRSQWRPPLDLVEDYGLPPHELDLLDGVITGCTVAVAETGMIALSASEEEGRRALTLVPDLHICVVETQQIVDLLPEAIEVLDDLVAQRRPLTLIAGPSATSDIEMKRVEGVHGPRNLVLIVQVEA